MEDIFKFCVLLTFGKSGTPVNTVMQINPPFHDSKWSVYFQLLNSRPTSCYMITWAWNATGCAPSTTLYIASIYLNSLKFQLCSASMFSTLQNAPRRVSTQKQKKPWLRQCGTVTHVASAAGHAATSGYISTQTLRLHGVDYVYYR